MRVRFLLAGVVFAAMLFLGWAWTSAQFVAVDPVPPRVMTGDGVGFRVEGLRAGKPVGTIVVRVNGQWVAAEVATPLTVTQRYASLEQVTHA